MAIKDYRGKLGKVKLDSDAELLYYIVREIYMNSKIKEHGLTIEEIMNVKVISNNYTKEDVLKFIGTYPVRYLFADWSNSDSPDIITYCLTSCVYLKE